MKKKTKKLSLRPSANTLRNLLIGYSIFASTIALVLIAGFLPLYQTQQRIAAETDFKMMMRDAALSVYDQPQRLAGGTKLYIPEARLAFPVTPGDSGILYSYQIANEGTPSETTPETVHLVSKSAINALVSQNGKFECQMLATISFSKYDQYQEGSFVYVGSVRLSDNREMFLYKNNSSACAPVWSGFTASSLVEQLKKAETYPTN